MTFDEVLQEPSDVDKLSTALAYLVMTIEEAHSVEDILKDEDFIKAKELLKGY